jgi:hypothetical protein
MLQKQSLNIPFRQGLDLKSDPYQIPMGKFAALNNSIFDTIGRLTKRNGFAGFETNPANNPIYLTTFKTNLISAGTTLDSYDSQTNSWQSKGNYQPVQLSTTPAIRNSFTQTQVDSAVNGNIACLVYTQTKDSVTFTYWYSIIDATTGQAIAPSVQIPTATESPRVFNIPNVTNGYFVIVFGTSSGLSYLAVNSTSFVPKTPALITSSYVPCANVSFDGAVSSSVLYLSWADGLDGLSAASISYSGSSISVSSIVQIDSSNVATAVSVCIDTTQNPVVIWVVSCQAASARAVAISPSLSIVLNPEVLIGTGSTPPVRVTSYAASQSCTAFFEFPSGSNWESLTLIKKMSIPQSGLFGALSLFANRCGLGSKAFLFNGMICVWATYQSVFQNSYFLLNPTGQVLTRIAYENGGGYLASVIPSVSIVVTDFWFPYLYKDLIESANPLVSPSSGLSPANIYSQTGINLLSFSAATLLDSSETGSNLNLSGGFLWAYDGALLNENNFFLFPEPVLAIRGSFSSEGAYANGVSKTVQVGIETGITISITGTITQNTNIISSVSSTTGIVAGMFVTGSTFLYPIPIINVNSTTSTLTLASNYLGSTTAGASLGVGAQVTPLKYQYVFVWEWQDNQGNLFRSSPSTPAILDLSTTGGYNQVIFNVPTLPFTYKTNVKLTGYRWSTANPVFYQFTELSIPVFNDPATNYVQIVDVWNDVLIIGNEILYTTGGTVEDTSPPATSIMTLFDDRLWLVDAEDTNLLWFSKQAIESAPLEMSDLFTYYVSPTIGGQGSTGPITALGAIDDKLIIFSSNSIRYINGTGPDNTGANNQYSQTIFVTSPVGCANQQSITQIPNGLVFQSDHGFWLLDHNMQVSYIGADVEGYNWLTCLSANTIPATTQVRFQMSDAVILVYDYFVGQWATFTMANSSYIISSTIYDGLQTLLDINGNVYTESPGLYSDGSAAVTMSFQTPWIELSGLQGHQKTYWLFLLGQRLSDHNLTVQIAYDFNPSVFQTVLFTPQNIIPLQWQIGFQRQCSDSFQLTVTESAAVAGPGLTLSGMNLIIGVEKQFPRKLPVTQKTG